MIGSLVFLQQQAADGLMGHLPDNHLIGFLKLEIWLFFSLLTGIIAYKLVTGGINTKGLLYTTEGKKLEFSTTRFQALIVILGAAAYYLYMVLTTHDFPKLPGNNLYEFFAILGGSNLIFLGGKLWTVFSERRKSGKI